jgi:hypothetical protein
MPTALIASIALILISGFQAYNILEGVVTSGD